eukprot:1562106-Prymnesium_polylepis.1
MPPEFAAHVCGHDLTPASAIFEYFDYTRAGCMPGSVVLGGWPSMVINPKQIGMGPKPASLS